MYARRVGVTSSPVALGGSALVVAEASGWHADAKLGLAVIPWSQPATATHGAGAALKVVAVVDLDKEGNSRLFMKLSPKTTFTTPLLKRLNVRDSCERVSVKGR